MGFVERWVSQKLGLINAHGNSLESIRQADTVAIRKVPELINPEPSLKTLQVIDSKVSETALLQRIASILSESKTPLAKAIRTAAKDRKFELLEVTQRKESEHLTIGWVMDRKHLIGSPAAIKKEGINLGPLESLAHALTRDGQAVSIVAAEGRPIGLISVHSALLPEVEKKYSEIAQAQSLKVVWTNDLPDHAAFEFRHQGRSLAENSDLGQLEATLLMSRQLPRIQMQANTLGALLSALGAVGLYLLDFVLYIPIPILIGLITSMAGPFWLANRALRAAQQTAKAS